MKGIQFYQFKMLLKSLENLTEEEKFYTPCIHSDLIADHKEKLKTIYRAYREKFEEISILTRQFDEHRLSIQRLASLHNQCKRNTPKRKHRKLALPGKDPVM